MDWGVTLEIKELAKVWPHEQELRKHEPAQTIKVAILEEDIEEKPESSLVKKVAYKYNKEKAYTVTQTGELPCHL